MKIECPKCGTRYQLDTASIPAGGRQAHCHRCRHQWRVRPEDDIHDGPTPEGARPLETATLVPDAPTAPANKPKPAPEPEPAPEPAPEPQKPAPPPETDADIEAMFGDSDPMPMEDTGGEFNLGTVDDRYQDTAGLGMDGDPLANEFDSGFGEVNTDVPTSSGDEPPPPPVPDLTQGPDPIPDMFLDSSMDPFGGDESEGKRGGGKNMVMTVLVLLALLLVGVGVGGWFFRAKMVTHFPFLKDYYAMVGIPVSTVGLGLEFAQVSPDRVAEGGREILIVRGVVNNTTETGRPMPAITLALYDGEDKEIGRQTIPPPVPSLPGEATVGFRVNMPDVPGNAHHYKVFFDDPAVLQQGRDGPQTGETAPAMSQPTQGGASTGMEAGMEDGGMMEEGNMGDGDMEAPGGNNGGDAAFSDPGLGPLADDAQPIPSPGQP